MPAAAAAAGVVRNFRGMFFPVVIRSSRWYYVGFPFSRASRPLNSQPSEGRAARQREALEDLVETDPSDRSSPPLPSLPLLVWRVWVPRVLGSVLFVHISSWSHSHQRIPTITQKY